MIVRSNRSEAPRFRGPLPPKEKPVSRDLRGWTRREIDSLREYMAHGYTYERIARELGRSRNSVIGYAWRNCR